MIYHVTFCFGWKNLSARPFSYVSDLPSMADFLYVLCDYPSLFATIFPAWLTSCPRLSPSSCHSTLNTKQTPNTGTTFSCWNALSTEFDEFWSSWVLRYQCVALKRKTTFNCKNMQSLQELACLWIFQHDSNFNSGKAMDIILTILLVALWGRIESLNDVYAIMTEIHPLCMCMMPLIPNHF